MGQALHQVCNSNGSVGQEKVDPVMKVTIMSSHFIS